MGIENLIPFFLGAIIIITVPGIDTVYIISRSISQGRTVGMYSAIGICCGIFVHTSMAAFGLSAIIAASAVLYSIIKYAGSVYLIYLGICALLSQEIINIETSGKTDEKTGSRLKVFKKGMLTNVLNPKPALFFFSFLPQFVKPGYTDSPFPFFLLGGLFFIMAITWCLFLAVSAASISAYIRQHDRFRQVLQKISGLIFIGLGIKVVLEKR